MRSRSTVRVMRGVGRWAPSPISLSVSEVGTPATAPTPARARAITASLAPRLTTGGAASWIRMIVAASGKASSPARTESTRCAPPGTKPSRSPRIFPSQSGGWSTYPGGNVTTTWRTSGCPMKARSARSSMGTPRMGRNCFGSPGPARTPAPAATTTTPTSGSETAGELTDSLQPNHLELVTRAARTRRQKDAPESLACRFGKAPLDAGHRTNLAAEAHLTEEQCVGRHRTIVDRGDEGGEDGKVGRWLHEPYATGDVHEDIQAAERQAAAALEHREEQGEAAMIQPGCDALWRPESSLRREGLDLDEHRACAFHQRRHRRAGGAGRAPRQERRGGIGDGLEAGTRHAKDADLVHRAEAILHRTQDPVVQRGFALEVEHRVDDVLERLRAGDAAAFGDVPDEQDSRTGFFREAHQARGAFADLPHVSRRALELFGVGGLHRIEEHDARSQLRGVMEDRFEPCFAEHLDPAGVFVEPVGAQA